MKLIKSFTLIIAGLLFFYQVTITSGILYHEIKRASDTERGYVVALYGMDSYYDDVLTHHKKTKKTRDATATLETILESIKYHRETKDKWRKISLFDLDFEINYFI